MQHPFGVRLMLVSCALALALALGPLAAEAKTAPRKPLVRKSVVTHVKRAARPEENTSTSRCDTPAVRAMYQAAAKQMEADIARAGAGDAEAAKTYRDKLAILWEAMQQPYCGHGSRGLRAVKHSFDKTVAKTRAEFLAAR